MTSLCSFLTLACVIFFTMACVATLAQNSPKDFVNTHNSARATVGVGLVSWDNDLAAYALKYAIQRRSDCQLKPSNGPYGENIFWGSGNDFTGMDAVQHWVSEKQYYDYQSNSCTTDKMCGYYTQVVWRLSMTIDCARVGCLCGGTFIICNYNPPGNYVGERPY